MKAKDRLLIVSCTFFQNLPIIDFGGNLSGRLWYFILLNKMQFIVSYTRYHLLKTETEEGLDLKKRRCSIWPNHLGIPLLVVISPIKRGVDVFRHAFTSDIK
jgi:hypothetical protein